MKNRLLVLMALTIVATSCVKTKTYYVNDASRAWFADSTNCNFTMRDDNGVSYSFQLTPARQEMLESGSLFLCIPTEKALNEEIYQSGQSSYHNQSLTFYAGLSAFKHDDETEGCDDFRLSFGEATYTMRIDGDTFYPRDCHDLGSGVTMDYTAEYIDSYTVSEKTYQGVMHLKLVDVAYPMTINFPTEIYYAKHYGLIQVTLDDKLTLHRLPN